MENTEIQVIALEDRDEMPFGKYKGEEMANVPADYLICIYENEMCSGYPEVRAYIEETIDFFRSEIKQSQNQVKSKSYEKY